MAGQGGQEDQEDQEGQEGQQGQEPGISREQTTPSSQPQSLEKIKSPK